MHAAPRRISAPHSANTCTTPAPPALEGPEQTTRILSAPGVAPVASNRVISRSCHVEPRHHDGSLGHRVDAHGFVSLPWSPAAFHDDSYSNCSKLRYFVLEQILDARGASFEFRKASPGEQGRVERPACICSTYTYGSSRLLQHLTLLKFGVFIAPGTLQVVLCFVCCRSVLGATARPGSMLSLRYDQRRVCVHR